jgi:hypothetical protein
MKEQKKDQKPRPQDQEEQTNPPTGGQQQTPGKAQQNPQNPPKQNPPRPTDVDEEDEELDPRQRRPA